MLDVSAPLSSIRFIGFHPTHQLCQFLREGRRNNVVECLSQVARERQRELHWVERCGRPTTHGYTSPREAFPALIVFKTYLAGAAFHFNEESVPCPAGRSRTLQFTKVFGTVGRSDATERNLPFIETSIPLE